MATSAGAIYVDVKGNTRPLEKSISGLASKLGGILSAAVVANFGRQCIDLASDLNEVQNVVDVTFPHMKAQMDEWAKSAAETFGLSETVAKRYAGTLGSMAESMGFTEQAAYDMATAVAGLAGDVASFYNLDADVAYEKLQSIFTGTVQPLRQLGINMTQANLDAYALANGFGKVTSEMTQAEQAALRFEYVSNALSNASGDFARTSSSWANQVRILQLRFETLQATIGQSLIAALLPVIGVVNQLILALTNAASAFYALVSAVGNSFVGKVASGIGKAAKGAVSLALGSSAAAESTSDLAAAQGTAAGSAGKQAAAQAKLNRTLAGFDRINKLTAQSASGGGGGGGGGVGGISDAIESLDDTISVADRLQAALDGLELPPKLTEALDHLRSSFERLATVLRGGFQWVWENVLQPLGEWTMQEVAPRLVETLATAFDVLSGILDALYPIWDVLFQNVIKPLGEMLAESFLQAWDDLNAQLSDLSDFIDDVLNPAFSDVAEWLETAIPKAIETVTKKFEKFVRFAQKAAVGLSKVMQGLATNDFALVGEGIADINDAWGELHSKNVVLNAMVKGTSSVTALGDQIKGTKGKTVAITADDQASSKIDALTKKGVANKSFTINATDYATAKIDALNKKVLKDHTAKLTFTPVLTQSTIKLTTAAAGNLAKLQFFAQGGYVERNTPRLAVIGDNRREGEIVSPESKFQSMLDQAVAMGGGNAETNTLLRQLISAVERNHGAVYLDGRDITRSVVANINRQTQSTGKNPLIV